MDKKSPSSYKKIRYSTRNRSRYRSQLQTFYFPTQPRPLIVFVDGRVHLGNTQNIKDEELRTLLRKKGYRVLELFYNSYLDKKRDELYLEK